MAQLLVQDDRMRGKNQSQRGVVCLIDLEGLVDPKHPIREVKGMCREVLANMDEELDALYAKEGRASIPPERLLMSWVLMALFIQRAFVSPVRRTAAL